MPIQSRGKVLPSSILLIPQLLDVKPDVFVEKNENPMDVLGIGSNMVKALRYWLQTVGLTTEPNYGKRTQSFTELGQAINEHDRHIEEAGTLYLLQYNLVSNKRSSFSELITNPL